MSSKVSSKRSCVRKGAGYNKVYPLGQDDPGASYPERVPSANSPFEEEEEDLDVDRLESGTSEDLDGEENIENIESPIRSIIGPDSLREFVLPLMWTVNDFNLTIKRKNFDTLWDRYQIPVDIPIRLPFKFEKSYYHGTDDVGVYK